MVGTANAGIFTAALSVLSAGLTRTRAEAPGNDGAGDAEAIAIPDTTDIGRIYSATLTAGSPVMSSITGTLACGWCIWAKDSVAPMGTAFIRATPTALNFVSKNTGNRTQTNDAADRCRENGSQSVAPRGRLRQLFS